MNKTYQLYIGANNITGDVETPLIERVLAVYYDGFTLQPSVGFWLGKKEQSVIVTVTSDVNTLNTVLSELKEVLHQDAIAWHEIANLQFF